MGVKVKTKGVNPSNYMKQHMKVLKKSSKELVVSEANRLSWLIKDTIEDRSRNPIEHEVAENVGVVDMGDQVHVTITEDRLSENEGDANLVLKEMEYGTNDKKAVKPVFKALNRFDSGDKKANYVPSDWNI